jgi:hypothetical protein
MSNQKFGQNGQTSIKMWQWFNQISHIEWIGFSQIDHYDLTLSQMNNTHLIT